MKRMVCLLSVLCCVLSLCACAPNQKELAFRDLRFGSYYGECADALVDGLKKDGFTGILEEYDETRYLGYHLVKTVGTVNVAGYDVVTTFYFDLPQGKLDVPHSRFYQATYDFKCKQSERDAIVEDLLTKLTNLYGKPQDERIVADIGAYAYIWNEFSNNSRLLLKVYNEKDGPDVDIQIMYDCNLKELDENTIITPATNNRKGL